MTDRIYLTLIGLLAVTLASCGGSAQNGAEKFSLPLYSPEYASGFTITGAEGSESSMITVTDPWQGAEGVSTQLFIARGGEKAPAGFRGEVLEGEASRIVTMSSTQIAMLDAIGESGRVVGVSCLDFITNPSIRNRRDSIGDVGYESDIDYELLLSLEPDIVLLYGVTGANPMVGKLRELGIPYMYVGDYLEQSPLGKAEWIVAIAELTGCRGHGEEVFAGIPERYNALRSMVADKALDAPSVMLNVPHGGSWFMPSATSYMARLIADAGGDYIYRKDTGSMSMPVDLEEARLLASQADMWLNVGNAASLAELGAMCPKFTDTRCYRNGDVYNNTLRATSAGGNDCYESAVVNPDLLLRDLVKIFHPGLLDDKDFVYYKRLL